VFPLGRLSPLRVSAYSRFIGAGTLPIRGLVHLWRVLLWDAIQYAHSGWLTVACIVAAAMFAFEITGMLILAVIVGGIAWAMVIHP